MTILSEIAYWEVVLRLLLSAVLGGLVGMEREVNNRPAGLRTHVLVSLGSCLVMLISMYGFTGSGDPARLAAQVVSGIGFLGAGTILRNGNTIKGLTTAASLWVCGCIGLAIGNGYYIGGLASAAIVLFTLISLGFFEKKINMSKYKILVVEGKERTSLIADIAKILGDNNIIIKDIKIIHDEELEQDEALDQEGNGLIEIQFTVKVPRKLKNHKLFGKIMDVTSVKNVKWIGSSF